MRNLFKTFMLLLVLGQSLTSCTKSSVSEDQNIFERATEGDDETPKEEKEDPNQ